MCPGSDCWVACTAVKPFTQKSVLHLAISLGSCIMHIYYFASPGVVAQLSRRTPQPDCHLQLLFDNCPCCLQTFMRNLRILVLCISHWTPGPPCTPSATCTCLSQGVKPLAHLPTLAPPMLQNSRHIQLRWVAMRLPKGAAVLHA